MRPVPQQTGALLPLTLLPLCTCRERGEKRVEHTDVWRKQTWTNAWFWVRVVPLFYCISASLQQNVI